MPTKSLSMIRSTSKNMGVGFFVLLVISIVIGAIFLTAYLVQITFNNSIVPLSKDPTLGHPRITELGYWNAFALMFLIAILVPGWQGLCYNSFNFLK
jgi:heme/copper-type cytochrome/quinol oxidase subunit 1